LFFVDLFIVLIGSTDCFSLLAIEHEESLLGKLLLHLEDKVLLVADELRVVEYGDLVLAEVGRPLDLEPARLGGVRENGDIDLVVVLGLLAVFAGVGEGHSSELPFWHLVLVVSITDVDVHDERGARDDLEPAALAGVVNGEPEDALVGRGGGLGFVGGFGRGFRGGRAGQVVDLGQGFRAHLEGEGVGASYNQLIIEVEGSKAGVLDGDGDGSGALNGGAQFDTGQVLVGSR
jgi:hypothetical protein